MTATLDTQYRGELRLGPAAYEPDFLERCYRHIISDAIARHPRTLQKSIGPSELGTQCARRLIHKLAGHEERRRGDSWLPTIGTALHSWIERAFASCQENYHAETARFLIEKRVNVGEIGDQAVEGTCDLFDIDARTALDWKFCGLNRIREYKRNGPGPQYRTQIHCYGRGMQRAGLEVERVMIAFIPRGDELSSAYFWSERYDEQIALAALQRADGLRQLVQAVGESVALALYPECADEFCPWCRASKTFAQPHAARTTTTMSELVNGRRSEGLPR